MKKINNGLGYLSIAAITIAAIIVTNEFDETLMVFAIGGMLLITFFGD